MLRRDLALEYCSIARAGAELTDAWTILILRELFLSNRTFEGIRRQTGMAPRSLSQRLAALENAKVVVRTTPKDKPRKAQYLLTEKGQDLWPAIVAIKQWGDKWFGPWENDLPPVSLTHKGCGHQMTVAPTCSCCGEPVSATASRPQVNPVFAEHRARRDALGKAARRSEATR